MFAIMKIKELINKSFAFKMLMVIIISIITAMAVLSSVFYFVIRNSYQQRLNASYENILSQYISSIENQLGIYRAVLQNIVMNEKLQYILLHPEEYNEYDIANQFSYVFNNYCELYTDSALYHIMVYAENDKFPSSVYSSTVVDVRNTDWYNKVRKERFHKFVLFSKTLGIKSDLISLVHPIVLQRTTGAKKVLGIIKIDLYAQKLFDKSNLDEISDGLYVVLGDGKIAYSINDVGDSDVSENINKLAFSDGGVLRIGMLRTKVKMKSGLKQMYYKNIDDNDIGIICVFGEENVKTTISYLQILLVIGCVLICSVFMIVISGFYLSRYSERVNILLSKMKKIQTGNFEVTRHLGGNDEIKEIDQACDIMASQLKTLIEQNYLQKIETKNAELKALYLQINPHFLYNTLESVSSIAAAYNCNEVCVISQKLGGIFRYSLNGGKDGISKLCEECQYINDYLQIQNIRFNNSIKVSYNISAKYLDMPVIKFCIQPLVENSIVHGFSGRENNEILISVRDTCEYTVVTVHDNGVGISADRVNSINKMLCEGNNAQASCPGHGIGLYNVHLRINCIFGKNYGLSLFSVDNYGTDVMLKFPKWNGLK